MKKKIIFHPSRARAPPSAKTGPRFFFFCIHYLPATGPSAFVSYLSTIEPHDYPHARNAIGSVVRNRYPVSVSFVSRPTCLARVDVDVNAASIRRRDARHTTTRYRFDDNVALFGDERTNERRKRSTHTARRSIDTRALVSLSTETRIERDDSAPDTMSGRYSRKSNDGVRAKRRCDDDDDDDDDEREYGDAMRRCGSRLGSAIRPGSARGYEHADASVRPRHRR